MPGNGNLSQWWDRKFDDLDRYGGYDVERLTVAARLQLQFFAQVINSVGLTAEQMQILGKVRSLVVPYQRNQASETRPAAAPPVVRGHARA